MLNCVIKLNCLFLFDPFRDRMHRQLIEYSFHIQNVLVEGGAIKLLSNSLLCLTWIYFRVVFSEKLNLFEVKILKLAMESFFKLNRASKFPLKSLLILHFQVNYRFSLLCHFHLLFSLSVAGIFKVRVCYFFH